MDGIDTNILVRYLTQDDVQQGQLAIDVIENDSPVYVSPIVLIETAWVLSRNYRLNRTLVAGALDAVIKNSLFAIPNHSAIAKALADFLAGFDFSDSVIAHLSKLGGCETIHTFDKKAAKHPYFQLLR